MKKILADSLCLLILLLACPFLITAQEERPPGKVFVIPLEGMIDGGLYSSVERRTKIALDEKPSIIIFKIDTYGGRLEPAFEISEYIADIPEETKTVAYIPKKAISAGALITVSCNEIAMGPQAELGDCEPIVPSAEGGYKTVGEKIQTVLRTKFRKFAEKNGYPTRLAEAMVTSEMEVYYIITEDSPEGRFVTARELKEMTEEDTKKIKSKKLIVEKGKLLTMHAREAKDYGFAKYIVKDRSELLEQYSVEAEQIEELVINWSEEMVRFLDSIAPILLSVGLIALWMEFKAPGFGLPGIIGILCLATVFLSKYMVGLAEVPEMIIFALGIMLIAVEVLLLPGFGLFGIAGIIFMLAGLVLAFQDFLVPQTPYHYEELRINLLQILSSMVGSLVIMAILVRYLPGMPLFGRLVLRASEEATLGFETVPVTSKEALIGKRGYTLSTLRPSGRAEFGGEVLDVVSQGEFIEPNQMVEVVEVRGNRVIVRPV
ncbi:MAG: nodulation protein NfeD [Candidatus Brocadiales bacterium]